MVSTEKMLEVSKIEDPEKGMKDWICDYMSNREYVGERLQNLDSEQLTDTEISQKLIDFGIEDIKIIHSKSPNVEVSDHYGFFYLKYFDMPDQVVRVGQENIYHSGRTISQVFSTLYPTELLQHRNRYKGQYKKEVEKWYRKMEKGLLRPAKFRRIFIIDPYDMTYASTFRFKNSSDLYRLIERAEKIKK